MEVKIHCSYHELVSPKDLKLNTRNTNDHPKDQIEDFAKGLIKFEFRRPVICDKKTKTVICGEGTVLSAIKAGIDKVPVEYQSFKSQSYAEAFGTFDNAIKQRSKVNKAKVNEFMPDWGPEIDFTDLGLKDLKLDPSELPTPKEECEHRYECRDCGKKYENITDGSKQYTHAKARSQKQKSS